jgi:hypothetical protein
MNIRQLFDIELPIVQAPVAGAQGSAMARSAPRSCCVRKPPSARCTGLR